MTESVLNMLKLCHPPSALVHVGAGLGVGETHAWHAWDIAQVCAIDADEDKLGWMDALSAGRSGWLKMAAVVADGEGEADFFELSNPAESGLLPAVSWHGIWPNLADAAVSRRPTHRLDQLLAMHGLAGPAQGRWLIVDCLDSLPVLQGAPATLASCSVVLVRVVLDSAKVPAGTSLPALTTALDAFTLVMHWESNHPAVGYALLQRDWPAQYRQQQMELAAAVAAGESKERLIAELQAQLGTGKAEVFRLHLALQEQMAEAARVEEALRAKQVALDSVHSELAERTVQQQAQQQALDAERAKAAQSAQAYELRITGLLNDQSARVAAAAALDTELRARGQRIQELERDLAAATDTQGRLAEEIMKAEVQLELIKELLL